MKIVKIIFLSLVLVSMLILPVVIFAQASPPPAAALNVCPPGKNLEECQKEILGQVGGKAGYGTQTNVQASDLANRVGRVIGMVLSVFGVVFLALVVYSGIQWMSAGGNEEKVTKARERIVRAAVGLGIVMMSYALTSFIVARMQQGGGGTKPACPNQCFTAGNCPNNVMPSTNYDCPAGTPFCCPANNE